VEDVGVVREEGRVFEVASEVHFQHLVQGLGFRVWGLGFGV